jgi:hypothetical protein
MKTRTFVIDRTAYAMPVANLAVTFKPSPRVRKPHVTANNNLRLYHEAKPFRAFDKSMKQQSPRQSLCMAVN